MGEGDGLILTWVLSFFSRLPFLPCQIATIPERERQLSGEASSQPRTPTPPIVTPKWVREVEKLIDRKSKTIKKLMKAKRRVLGAGFRRAVRKAGLEPPPVGLPMLVRQAMVWRQIQQKIDLGRSVQRQLKERK